MGETLTAADGQRLHPLLLVGRELLLDFLSTLVFVGLYAATHSLKASVALAIGIGVAQVAWSRLRRRPIDTMQWLSLGLVIVFGAASLLTHNPRFVMFKPTLIYCVVGGAMLKPGWQKRYLPPIAVQRAGDVCFVFGYVWAALMFATAAANLALVLGGSAAMWAWFVGVFPLASKIGFVLIQYGVTRLVVGHRMRRSGVEQAATAA